MKPVTMLVIAILPVLLLIGCGEQAVKKDQTASTSVSVDEGRAGGATTAGAPQGTPLGDEGIKSNASDLSGVTEAGAGATPGEAAETPAADLLSERKIYFDFDKSDIKDEFHQISSVRL